MCKHEVSVGQRIYSDFKSFMGWSLIILISLIILAVGIAYWETVKPFVILGVVIWLFSLWRDEQK